MTTTGHARRPRGAHTDEKVTTWADGFGTWHAKITFPAPGYDLDELPAHADRVRRKARRAIRAEITARDAAGPGWVCRIAIAETDRGADEVTRSITYRETPPADPR